MVAVIKQIPRLFPPGVHLGVDNDTYHSGAGVSKSMLDRIAISPAHLKYGVREETKATQEGTAIHTAVLEPSEFDKRYYKGKDIRRGTKEWAAFEDLAGGRIVLKPEQWDECERIRDAVHRHPTAGALLTGNTELVEQSAYWIDEETGILCRCRPDYARPDLGALIDLKSTVSANSREFARSCANYRYHVQNAWYQEGYSLASGSAIEAFVFIAVEKEPPYAVGVYMLEQTAVERGHELAHENLRLYAQCYNAGVWPAYSDELQVIELPSWAYQSP